MKNLYDYINKPLKSMPEVGSPEYELLVEEALNYVDEKMKGISFGDLSPLELNKKLIEVIREWGDICDK